jgi:phage FluMu protein Com
MSFAGTGWILWAVALFCVSFTLWLLIDAWRVRRRIQREFGEIKSDAEAGSGHGGGDRRGAKTRGHIEITCQHCKNGILVPKPRRFNEVDCPSCGQVNPAPRKDRLAFIKDFLRWLLYPSFQRKD